MHANCYAAFNRNWLGLRRRVGVESGFAGPQSRNFKRWAVNFCLLLSMIQKVLAQYVFQGDRRICKKELKNLIS
jgi:hypothetical protein